MPINGDFRYGNGLSLQEKPWFDKRINLELKAIRNASVPLIQIVDLCPTSKFPKPDFLAIQFFMHSRNFADVSYGLELVLPSNWPFGEPVCFVYNVQAGMSLPRGSLSHIYTEPPFQDCICTHVQPWDSFQGTSTLAAYLFAVSVWLHCFEKWIELDGELNYTEWSNYAKTLD